MSLLECARSARRNWYLLLICALVAAGATLAFSFRETPEYRATTRLVAGPAPGLERPTRIAQAVDALNRRPLIATFAEITSSGRIFGAAAAGAGLSSADASRYSVSSNALPEANVVLLEVRGPHRPTTIALSTEIAGAAGRYVESFYTTYSLRALDVPDAPGQPVSPRPERNVPVAAVAGLGLGLLLGLWRDRLYGRRTWTPVDAPPSGS